MRSKAVFRQSIHLSCPNLTPLAGVFLAINCLFLFTYFSREPRHSLVLLEETPQYCPACFSVPSTTSIVVGLGTDGHTSFATYDTDLQTATLELVSRQYSIICSTTCTNRLKKLPFLAVNLEELPNCLVNADSGTTHLAQRSAYPELTDEQLLSCVLTARKLAPTYVEHSANISLLIDARTDASKVMHLLQLFQNQGIGQFNLITHCR